MPRNAQKRDKPKPRGETSIAFFVDLFCDSPLPYFILICMVSLSSLAEKHPKNVIKPKKQGSK
jgi:hypothetical protein